MRKLAIFGLLLLPLLSAAQETSLLKVWYGADANERYAGAKVVRDGRHTPIPSYVEFSSGREIPYAKISSWINNRFNLTADHGIVQIEDEKDRLGMMHYRYQQTYHDLPVEFTMYMIHTKGGMVKSMSGVLMQLALAAPSPAVSEQAALATALSNANGTLYKWEAENRPEPKGSLVYVPTDGDFSNEIRLAWKFDIYAYEPLYKADVYVDALSGKILFESDQIHTINDTGTAVTGYSGTVTIIADSFVTDTFRLRETGRGNGIETYDLNNSTNHSNGVDFLDLDNYWDNVNAQLDEYATDAHWGCEMTYDYFWYDHGRNSIDDAGFKLKSYVHYGTNYGNAFWNGSVMTYGDGGSNNPFQSLDVCGHEVAHGLTTNTSGLIYNRESGALNESFSDIFGTAIEFYGKGGSANWLLGEDLGFTIRSMENPNLKNDPDTYKGTHWHTAPSDNYGVHTNSGVQNYWYYILSEGESGINDNNDTFVVNALGMTKASAIAFRNNTIYLTPSSNYDDARFFAIQSAIDLYGGCTMEVIETANAWYAVGVGDEFDSTVAGGFNVHLQESCSAPFTARFTNLSQNGEIYSWDYGDGSGLDTVVNPNHTYMNYGVYNVTLYVDGGACGSDTVAKIGYISVDSVNPCVVILPSGGSGLTQTMCTGTVYDDGGPSGDYSNNVDADVTISPTGATNVFVLFTKTNFDVEAGSGSTCNYDYVELFDGPTTGSASLGQWCNTTGPPDTVISSGGDITLLQHTDPGLSLPGFEMKWWCVTPTSPPMAGFQSDFQITCDGEIQFFDNSIANPTSWFWDFGDGNTSTQQNPKHFYTTNDTFTVSMVATNANGSDSMTRTEYIIVDRPTAVTTTNDSACGPATLTLTASGASGSVYWYDTAVGGSPLFAGTSYITPSLTNTKTYYAEDLLPSASQNVGPLDTSIGTGAFINNNQYLIFDVDRAFTLVSVMVNPDTFGTRTIEWRDKFGNVLDSKTVNIAGGPQRVTLNFNMVPGTDYQLGVSSTGHGFFRNNGGVSFPYEIPGWVSIHKSSNASFPYLFYFFYYDWEIQGPDCTSPRTPAVAYIRPGGGTVSIAAPDTVCEGQQITITVSGGQNYVWSTGDTGSSITITPSSNPQTVSVVSTAECKVDTLEHTFVIDSLPDPSFTYLQNTNTFTFFNESRKENSVSWNFGDGNTDITPNPTHSYSGPGSYNVTLTATNDCGSVDTTITVTVEEPPNGIQGNQQWLGFYPNPATTHLSIRGVGVPQEIMVTFTNVLGQQVLRKALKLERGNGVVDVSQLAAGTYQITLQSGSYVTNGTLVVQD